MGRNLINKKQASCSAGSSGVHSLDQYPSRGPAIPHTGGFGVNTASPAIISLHSNTQANIFYSLASLTPNEWMVNLSWQAM